MLVLKYMEKSEYLHSPQSLLVKLAFSSSSSLKGRKPVARKTYSQWRRITSGNT